MKRVALSLLIAYAAAITVIAAWFGCRAYVLHRICAMYIWLRPGGLPVKSFEDNQTFAGVARHMTGLVDTAVIGVANIHLSQIAAVAGLAFLGCFALATVRRNAPKSPNPTLPKD